MVRVITGKAKRKKLVVPCGIRPTLDRVKESVFNIIGEGVKEQPFLDMFAGTGSMGIEALSRGAPSGVFVEKDSLIADVLNGNLSKCNFSGKVYTDDIFSAMETIASVFSERNFLVYADPPFDGDFFDKVLESSALQKLVSKGGKLIIEHPFKKGPACKEFWNRVRMEKYGSIGISFFEKV